MNADDATSASCWCSTPWANLRGQPTTQQQQRNARRCAGSPAARRSPGRCSLPGSRPANDNCNDNWGCLQHTPPKPSHHTVSATAISLTQTFSRCPTCSCRRFLLVMFYVRPHSTHLAVEVPGAAGGECARQLRRHLQDAVVHRHAAAPAAVPAFLRILQAQQACDSSNGPN